MIQALPMSRKQKHASTRSQRRTAFTLVETIVVTVVSSLVLGIVVSLLVALQRHDQSMRRNSLRNDQMARLAEAIRADVRSGTKVTIPAIGELVVAGTSAGDVHYKIVTEGCERTTSAGDSPATTRELLSVGPATAWQVEFGPDGRKPLQIVSLIRKDDIAGGASRPLVIIQAALGADAPPNTTN
jgi:type II secretory pathway pseudopilin PulG